MSTNQRPAPQATDAYLEAVGSLLALHRRLRTYSRKRSATGITGKQLAVLRHLDESGPQTVGALARYLFVSEASTSELLGKLADAGLISRARSDQDGRVVRASVTDEGARTARETPLGGIPLLRERMKELSEEDLLRISDSMNLLVKLLEATDG